MSKDNRSGLEFRRMSIGEAVALVLLMPVIVGGTALVSPTDVSLEWVVRLAAGTAVLTALWCIKGLTVGTYMPRETPDPLAEVEAEIDRLYGPDHDA